MMREYHLAPPNMLFRAYYAQVSQTRGVFGTSGKWHKCVSPVANNMS